MNIKQITYSRTKNLGNYESERLELIAELDEGEDEDEAVSKLKHKVEQYLFATKNEAF